MEKFDKGGTLSESIEFEWDFDAFQFQLESCKYDDAVQVSLNYMTDKNLKILEAGSGSGRVVKYFSDLGYKNVYGIELNKEIVHTLNRKYPELKVIQGSILKMPYEKNRFDIVVSYGLVEHFPKGLKGPLLSLFNVLKPGGTAIITVPSFNHLRQFKLYIDKYFRFLCLRKNNFIRKLLRKKLLPTKRNVVGYRGYMYYVYPQFGDFLEYRLKPREFEDICKSTGFELLESIPISHIDGLYHEATHNFRKYLLKFDATYCFEISKPARYLNELLKKKKFFHNHMHACVLKKPLT
ncbi:MAG: class I SAM-dependent methyltransferase [bacterium]